MKKIILSIILFPIVSFCQQSEAALSLIFNMLNEKNPNELLDDWRLESVEEHLGEDQINYLKYIFHHDNYSDKIFVINYAVNDDYKNELALYFYNQKLFNELKKAFKKKGYKQIEKDINFEEQIVIFQKKNIVVNTIEYLNPERRGYFIRVFDSSDSEKREKRGLENKIQNYLNGIESELTNWGEFNSDKDKVILNESEIRSFVDDIVSPFIIFFDKINEVYSENNLDNDIKKIEKEIYTLLVSSVIHHVSAKFKNIQEKINLVSSNEDTYAVESIGQLLNEYVDFFLMDCNNFGRTYVEDEISCFSVNETFNKRSNVKKEFNKLIRNLKAFVQEEQKKIETYIDEGDEFLKNKKYLEAYLKYESAEIKAQYWHLNSPIKTEYWLDEFQPHFFLEICLEKKHLSQYYIQMKNIENKFDEARSLIIKGDQLNILNAINKYEEIAYELSCEDICKFKFCEWRNESECNHDKTTWVYDHPENLDKNLMIKYYYFSKQKISELTAVLKQKEDQERIWSYKDEKPEKYDSFLNQIQAYINNKIIKKNNGEIEFFFKIKFDELGNNLSGPMDLDSFNTKKNSIYNDSYIAEFDNYSTSKSTSKIIYSLNENTGEYDSSNEIIDYFVPSEEIIKFYCTWSSEKKYIDHHPKNPGFSQKIIYDHPYLSDSYGSYKLLTKAINIEDKNNVIEKSILEFKANNGPKYAFYSFLLPGLGTSKVTNGQKGKGKTINFLLATAASVGLRIYSNIQYDKYLNATNKDEINDLYDSANMFNKISLGTTIIAASIYIQDIISSFSKGYENIKKSKLLRTKLKDGRLKILDLKPLQPSLNTDLKSINY